MKRVSNKVLGLSLLVILLVSFTVSFVIAQDTSDLEQSTEEAAENVEKAVDMMIRMITAIGRPIFKGILGTPGDKLTGGDLVTRVLLFCLVVAATYGLLEKAGVLGNSGGVHFMIGVFVAALGVRFIPESLISAIAFPSSIYVAFLALFMPFLLVTWILMDQNPVIRKIGWISYGAVTFVLLMLNIRDNNVLTQSYGIMVYGIIIVFCVALFILDGTLIRIWKKWRDQGNVEELTSEARARLLTKIENFETLMSTQLANNQNAKAAKTYQKIEKFKKILKTEKF